MSTDTAAALQAEMDAALGDVQVDERTAAERDRIALADAYTADIERIRTTTDDALADILIEHLADRLAHRITWLESDLARARSERAEADERATKWMNMACDLVTKGFADAMELGRQIGQGQAAEAAQAGRPAWLTRAGSVALLGLFAFLLIGPAVVGLVSH